MALPGGRPTFLELPSGKVRDPRRVAQVINGAMAGKTNNVGDATILAGEFGVAVQDVRCSEWSYVHVIPTNFEALSADIIVAPNNGYFDLLAYSQDPQYGTLIDSSEDSMTVNTTWNPIQNYDINEGSAGIIRDAVAGTMIPSYAGTYLVYGHTTIVASNNVTYQFGFGTDGNDPGSWVSILNRLGNNVPLPLTYTGTVEVTANAVIDLRIRRTSGSSATDISTAQFMLTSQRITDPSPVSEDATWRYVIIG